MLFDALEAEGKKVSGSEEAVAELKREFPHGEMDIVIMNPPYLTTGADMGTTKGKQVFGSEFRSKEEQLQDVGGTSEEANTVRTWQSSLLLFRGTCASQIA